MKLDKPTINWMAIISGVIGIASGIAMSLLNLDQTIASLLIVGGAGLLFPVSYGALRK
jgi:hypothetical protein